MPVKLPTDGLVVTGAVAEVARGALRIVVAGAAGLAADQVVRVLLEMARAGMAREADSLATVLSAPGVRKAPQVRRKQGSTILKLSDWGQCEKRVGRAASWDGARGSAIIVMITIAVIFTIIILSLLSVLSFCSHDCYMSVIASQRQSLAVIGSYR